MFIQRSLENALLNLGNKYSVILVTGARQVGKSTLLKHAVPDADYVTLDDPEDRLQAQKEPKLFLSRFNGPTIIDEVQYAPELFPLIKMRVDESQRRGQFWLSGSQQFHMMKNVTESLAGRVAVLSLAGLSTRELLGEADAAPLEQRLSMPVNALPVGDVFERIWRGSYPALHDGRGLTPEEFYPAYVQTYLQRDVRDLARVGDETAFLLFMQLAAARTGQLLNMHELGNQADISNTRVRNWLSILEASGIITFVAPYHTNHTSTLVKAKKMYFLDTGLAAWLGGWKTAEALARGAAAGAFLENYVVSEVLKGRYNSGQQPDFTYFRDHNDREVDILSIGSNTLVPIEVKTTSRPDGRTARRLMLGDSLNLKQGHGAIVCMVEKIYPLSETVNAFPAGMV
ncbi:ATP-binding protein [Filomicrobium sp.]|uniref:ATP-binding protein n=1 Tax=Filomicrobium sp. TaxID=2024831 RepID=UPI00258CE715|nr:ATP-binding protein [Filomicrobium sp.]MCV0371837.1 ATP-binding protein [Filomicrobium sp.]